MLNWVLEEGQPRKIFAHGHEASYRINRKPVYLEPKSHTLFSRVGLSGPWRFIAAFDTRKEAKEAAEKMDTPAVLA